MKTDLTAGLNQNQIDAVTAPDGAVLVLAGPGSGKTRVLTHRVAYLINEQNISPYNIMAVTFTNKAANEMRQRIERMGYRLGGMLLGTFHAISARILREEAHELPHHDRNFTIYDTSDQRSLIKSVLTDLNKDPQNHRPYDILSKISNAKNEMLSPAQFPTDSYRDEVAQEVYAEYQRLLHSYNAMDFDDLLNSIVWLLENKPDIRAKYRERVRYLLVDEFQDTNMAQYQFVRLMSNEQENVFVVGDPDQSIYAFRGADYRNIERFQRDFPDHQVVKLEENYRSHQIILDAAMGVIRGDPNHIKRNLISQRQRGTKIELHETQEDRAEAQLIAHRIMRLRQDEGYSPNDFAIIYRTNSQSRVLEIAMRDNQLPYKLIGNIRFYDRKEIKDALSYLYVINNPNDIHRLMRIINEPKRGIGKQTQQKLIDWARQHSDGMWSVLRALKNGETGPLSKRAATSVVEFAKLFDKWIMLEGADELMLPDFFETILRDIDYENYLAQQAKTEEEADAKQENLNELRREMQEYATLSLSDYLEQNALVADTDQIDSNADTVTLMTMHAAKGLEFPVVFIPGVEDDLLPHNRSKDSPQGIAEERRLFYVGITRAKDRLYLSFTKERFDIRAQSTRPRKISPFVGDIPEALIDLHSPWRSTMGVPSYSRPMSSALRQTWGGAQAAPIPSRPQRFNAGDVVYHAKFGLGHVQNVIVQDDIEEVEVKFEDGFTKRMDGDFLKKK